MVVTVRVAMIVFSLLMHLRETIRGALVMLVMLVPVVPQLRLVEQEKEHQPEQQHSEQYRRLDAALEGLGQQVHEGGCQQRASGQTQQMLWIQAASVTPHTDAHQQGRKPDAADAGN